MRSERLSLAKAAAVAAMRAVRELREAHDRLDTDDLGEDDTEVAGLIASATDALTCVLHGVAGRHAVAEVADEAKKNA